jgi:hypothetical protein
MQSDVNASLKKTPGKIPSKETLNNREIIEFVSGLDVYKNTSEAYLRAYEALGIDIINRVPLQNAPPYVAPGQTGQVGDYTETNLGVYSTMIRNRYPFKTVDDFLMIEKELKFDYESLITPVPHTPGQDDIINREKAVGSIGYYYYQLYTTLFMWGVEVLGWEVYMMASALDSEKLDKLFLQPAFKKSKLLIEQLSVMSSPFLFLHDDLSDARGPIFQPEWYDEYIFPRYTELFSIPRKAGKKIILVADGNMEAFFPKLLELGIDGVMFENPATNFDAIIEAFKDKIIIGGVETTLLTLGTPEEIKAHVYDVRNKTRDCSGYVISTPGGLHGNIPLKNSIAYFDARVDIDATPKDWKTRFTKE